jgi:hypothetical protein
MRYSCSSSQSLLIVAWGVFVISQRSVGSAEELPRPGATQKVSTLATNDKPAQTATDEIASSHPLSAVMEFARAEKLYLRRKVQSVSCRLVKRERIEGKLQAFQFIDMELQEEIRNGDAVVRPMRVFLSFVSPSEVKGRKVLFIEGANKGKMLVRKGGRRFNYAVIRIEPMGENAQRESLVPVTELGFGRLLDRQIQVLASHAHVDPTGENTEVQHFTNAKINGRACEVIRVVHPKKQPGLTFHTANVYVDNELHLPVRIDASEWPEEPGGVCPVLAEYTYTDIRLNVDYPEATFDEDRLKQ